MFDLTLWQANNTLHKQNFDLKLELFHRRQRQADLEDRLQTAEAKLAEQEELQSVNEQLLSELQKRDQAVEEAVAIICKLEEDIERLLHERDIVNSFDADYDSSFLSRTCVDSNQGNIPSSPPDLSFKANKDVVANAPSHIARMPSFLSERSENAEALRSLYLPKGANGSVLSLPRLLDKSEQEEDMTTEMMNSPRLSVLSESSFLSVYGDKKLAVEALNLETLNNTPRGHRKSSSSIDEWLQDGATNTSYQPPTPTSRSNALPNSRTQPLSLNAVLESPLQQLERLDRTSLANSSATSSQRRLQALRKIKPIELRNTHTPQYLPPTPDTVSTATLGLHQTSRNTLNHEIGARHASKHSPPTISKKPQRPRSACETITSRREGHGWDTATMSDLSLTAGDDQSIEEETPELATAHESRVHEGFSARDLGQIMWQQKQQGLAPPDMFSFATMDEEPLFTEKALGIYGNETYRRGWGTDMMFNNDSGFQIPSTSGSHQRRNVCVDAGQPGRNGAGILQSSAREDRNPDPPPRRSSLGRHKTGRRNSASGVTRDRPAGRTSTDKDTGSSPQGSAAASVRQTTRSRLTARLFGRSESFDAPLPNNSQESASQAPSDKGQTFEKHSSSTRKHRPLPRSQTCQEIPQARSGGPFDPVNKNLRRQIHAHPSKASIDAESLRSLTSATPPPISRYPRSSAQSGLREVSRQTSGPSTTRRPSSAGVAGGHVQVHFGDKVLPGRRSRGRSQSQAGSERDPDYGIDGGGDPRPKTVGHESKPPISNSGVKKWLSLGRSGSMKR